MRKSDEIAVLKQRAIEADARQTGMERRILGLRVERDRLREAMETAIVQMDQFSGVGEAKETLRAALKRGHVE